MTIQAKPADDSSATAEVAALVLTAAMADTQSPSFDLGDALERMARTVHAWRNRPVHVDGVAEADQCCEAVANDLAICMQSLQYHDRLMQQLTAIRELLASLNQRRLESRSEREWQDLVQQLRGRVTRGSQNQIVNLLMSSSARQAAAGSVELF